MNWSLVFHPLSVFLFARNIPGIRQNAACKFKGSFLFQKMDTMGDPSLRVRLHARRVHKWAGPLFPDDSENLLYVTNPERNKCYYFLNRHSPLSIVDGVATAKHVVVDAPCDLTVGIMGLKKDGPTRGE